MESVKEKGVNVKKKRRNKIGEEGMNKERMNEKKKRECFPHLSSIQVFCAMHHD